MSEEKCIEMNGGHPFSDSTDERLSWRIFDRMTDAVRLANPFINDGIDRLAHRLASQVPRDELYRTVRDRLARIQKERTQQQDAQDFRTATAGLI